MAFRNLVVIQPHAIFGKGSGNGVKLVVDEFHVSPTDWRSELRSPKIRIRMNPAHGLPMPGYITLIFWTESGMNRYRKLKYSESMLVSFQAGDNIVREIVHSTQNFGVVDRQRMAHVVPPLSVHQSVDGNHLRFLGVDDTVLNRTSDFRLAVGVVPQFLEACDQCEYLVHASRIAQTQAGSQ